MKERGIIMSGPMVLALLAGRKSQTRRIVKLKPYQESKAAKEHWEWKGDDMLACCPYGVVGDRLWVREKWFIEQVNPQQSIRSILIGYCADAHGRYRYECDHKALYIDKYKGAHGKPRPSIHMPRWASRITLELTGVRVEQLQEISGADILAEGCALTNDYSVDGMGAERTYAALWDSLHGKGAWDKNPWVWVLGLKVVEGVRATED